MNSSELLQEARRVYYAYLSTGSSGGDPVGIVLSPPPKSGADRRALPQAAAGGRVVFDPPVLLPDEQYVPIDWLRIRGGGRTRPGRPAGGRLPL